MNIKNIDFYLKLINKSPTKESDILAYPKQQGRNSINKNHRNYHKERSSNILPFNIRGNYDYKREETDESRRKKSKKDSNSWAGKKLQDHPMIINQMHDPKTFSRLGESYWADILTPKSAIREIKPLKTTKSYNSNTKSTVNKMGELEISMVKPDQSNHYLKKIAYELNLKDDGTNSEKVIF